MRFSSPARTTIATMDPIRAKANVSQSEGPAFTVIRVSRCGYVRNGGKADIGAVISDAMMPRAYSLVALCSLVGCRQQIPDASAQFALHARYVAITQTVVITLTNRSAGYLCVATWDVTPGSPLIKVLPASKDDSFENRPPPDLIGDFDVRGGVQVVPPGKNRDLYLELSTLDGRQPPATAVRGRVRATPCRELFSSARPRATEQPFEVALSKS